MQSATLDNLNHFHDRHAGASDRIFGAADAGGGRTSYDLLVDEVPADAASVLDLACGDGPVLQRLRARGHARLVGLDQSQAELAAARRRLGPEAELVHGLAQALPFPDSSFEAVSCHMALMLMDQPAEVISELHRVLVPGGTLAFVVGRWEGTPPEQALLWSFLRARFVEEAIDLKFGEGEWGREDWIAALLEPGFEELRFHGLETCSRVPIGELARWLGVTYYPVDRISEEGRAALAAFIAENAATLAPDGVFPWTLEMRLGVARRRGAA